MHIRPALQPTISPKHQPDQTAPAPCATPCDQRGFEKYGGQAGFPALWRAMPRPRTPSENLPDPWIIDGIERIRRAPRQERARLPLQAPRPGVDPSQDPRKPKTPTTPRGVYEIPLGNAGGEIGGDISDEFSI